MHPSHRIDSISILSSRMVGLSDPHEAKWINFPGRINHFLKESLRKLEASKEAEPPKSGVDQIRARDLVQIWARSLK